jgi:hypothetical protein
MPGLELPFRFDMVVAAIKSGDTASFVDAVMSWLDAVAYLHAHRAELIGDPAQTFNFGRIPNLAIEPLAPALGNNVIREQHGSCPEYAFRSAYGIGATGAQPCQAGSGSVTLDTSKIENTPITIGAGIAALLDMTTASMLLRVLFKPSGPLLVRLSLLG